jgi:myo-inositol-1-phosphate synthase
VPRVKVAIAGVGNCASALVQGVHYYKLKGPVSAEGLISYELGGIRPEDIEFVAAFDVDSRKVGKDLAEAIFEPPNNTLRVAEVPKLGVEVKKAPVLDGLGKYLSRIIRPSDAEPVQVEKELRDSGAEVLVNYVPVGSREAAAFYAESALKAGAAFVNAMPVFIASDRRWQERYAAAKLPLAGDDVMSQLGATVLHKTLVKLFVDRGVKVDETYQLNIGGDTDFLNMLEEGRLEDKRASKTSAVEALLDEKVPIRIGPSDYVEFLENYKVCYIWIKGRYFAGAPVELDVKLKVIDAYNSAGIIIDAIRGSKLALERGIAGPLISLSAYCFKHPPVQMPYHEAREAFLQFVRGERER